MSTTPVTPIGRVAFPNLARARKPNENTDPRYSVTLVFDKDTNLDALKKAADECVKEAFGNKKVPNSFRYPFRDGASRSDDYEGFNETDTFIEFWRREDKGAPPVVDQKRNPCGPGDVYAGCLGRVGYRPYVYNKAGNQGVNFHLEAFQKAGDGEPTSGAAPVDATEVFEDIEDELADVLR